MGGAVCLDVIQVHWPGSIILLGGLVLSVGFLVYTVGFSVIFVVAWEVGCIVSFSHLHEFSQGLLPFVDGDLLVDLDLESSNEAMG
jgi:hypothetical protein